MAKESGDNTLEQFQELKRELQIGDRTEDGMIFAGITPSTGKPFYARAEDERLMMDLYEARATAKRLGLRLPEDEELNVMFSHQAKMGGFKDAFYLSATQIEPDYDRLVRTQHREFGQHWDFSHLSHVVRFVRS